MLISVCSFPLVSTSSHHDNHKSQCWPRTLELLGLYEMLQKKTYPLERETVPKEYSPVLNLNDKCINWSRLCNQNLVHLRLPGSCGTGRMPLAKKNEKHPSLPWFVFFCRWDLEITAPFYMTGSNLLPNYGGLLIWIGWTGDVGPMESNVHGRLERVF